MGNTIGTYRDTARLPPQAESSQSERSGSLRAGVRARLADSLERSVTRWRSAARNPKHSAETAVFVSMLDDRVTRAYGANSGFPAQSLAHATRELHRILDPVDWAFFAHELRDMARRPEVRDYLSALETELGTGDKFNLWKFTRARAASDAEAIRWIGVLLQDFCLNHPKFFDAVDDEAFRVQLGAVIEATRTALQEKRLDPFPEDAVNARYDAEPIYHYYVPAYLAQELVRPGKRLERQPRRCWTRAG